MTAVGDLPHGTLQMVNRPVTMGTINDYMHKRNGQKQDGARSVEPGGPKARLLARGDSSVKLKQKYPAAESRGRMTVQVYLAEVCTWLHLSLKRKRRLKLDQFYVSNKYVTS